MEQAKQQPRKTETVLVRSTHRDFKNVGDEVYVTPEEANTLLLIGRAELIKAPKGADKIGGEYLHREMTAKGRHRK